MPFVDDDTRRVEPPALPITPITYDKKFFDQFNNILRLYFARLSTVLRILMSETNYGVYPYGSAADAFGRLRISDPVTLFDSKQTNDNQPLYWDDSQVSGSGTSSTHSSAYARSRMSVSASTAGKRIRQTYERFNYQPGKSQLVYMTGVLGSGGSGITTRMGIGDDDNGLFFECDDGVVYVNVRSSTSGSAVNTRVAQSAWNKDTLDGNGASAIEVDWDKALIFLIDYEWLGVGTVRFGIVVGAVVYYVHQVDNSNSLANVYMSTPNLPLRYEIENDGTGGAANLDHICSTVITEGGQLNRGMVRSASTAGAEVTCSTDNISYAILGIKLKSSYLDAAVRLKSLGVQIQSTTKMGMWELRLNPTVGGTFTYSNQTNSAVQIAKGASANEVTGGTVLETGFAFSSSDGGGAGTSSQEIGNTRNLGASISGTADTLVLCFKPLNGSNAVKVEGFLNWREL